MRAKIAVSVPPELSFAENSDRAQAQYDQYGKVDPFPSIPPALLTSADLADYVAATGMIFPFNYQKEKLKPASYEVALAGPSIWYDATGARRYQDLNRGEEFILEANSIAFVTLEPEFRIPTYLAIRFNLRITQIYRGLLLGTGPLVDPGFTGRLSLPLHNWTDNDYVLVGGEGLIWIEVTKLSPAEKKTHAKDKLARAGTMFYLEEKKLDLTLLQYLRKADPHRPIRSSIPIAIEEAKKAAQRASSIVQNLGLAAAIGLAVALTAIVISVVTLVNQADSATNASRSELAQSQAALARLSQRLCSLEATAQQAVSAECRPSPSATPATSATATLSPRRP